MIKTKVIKALSCDFCDERIKWCDQCHTPFKMGSEIIHYSLDEVEFHFDSENCLKEFLKISPDLMNKIKMWSQVRMYFKLICKNWNGYNSDPPNNVAMLNTEKIIKALQIIPDGIIPSAEGGIVVYFVRNGKYADIECLNSGKILAVISNSEEEREVWEVDKKTWKVNDENKFFKDTLSKIYNFLEL